jgi:NAD(P)-dependent dehydrogenase (short-subunit alcohol dehydrogenase family)
MTGRTVIVTGGFGTLGRAVADAFTAAGDKVARIDFVPSAQVGQSALDIGNVDIADPAVAETVVRQVSDALGAPSVLVNIAGGFVWEPLAGGGAPTWERMFRMNALTAASMAKAAAPVLTGQASIINIGANAAQKAAAGMGGYTASKAAVHKLTESLAEELKGKDITVNAVLPSIIDTPVNRADMPDADPREWIRPEALAEVILFLASPAARTITGALIPVTRGDAG